MLRRLAEESFDVLVIGGGITGVGVALDAATRGLRTALVERDDFASGTSSKSSKLVHGGLRYLQQGDVRLVYQALAERQRLRHLAPHLVRVLPFMIPILTRDGVMNPKVARALGSALWTYDLTGGARIGKVHRRLKKDAALAHLPTMPADRLASAYIYYDARTDDARLCLTVARTAVEHGAVVANGARVIGLRKDGGRVIGATALAGGDEIPMRAAVVVNATGVWSDDVRALDEGTPPNSIRPAKGIHLTVPWDKVRNDIAVVIPVPKDRRSLFVVPWGAFTYVGTTDTDYHGSLDDPQCTKDDVDYVLRALNQSVTTGITESDITGAWAGLRPLVKRASSGRTADLSRKHRVEVSADGMISVTGGKLTTYRLMAADTVDQAMRLLDRKGRSMTKKVRLAGAEGYEEPHGDDARAHLQRRYGTLAAEVEALIAGDRQLARPSCPVSRMCKRKRCTRLAPRWPAPSTTCSRDAPAPASSTSRPPRRPPVRSPTSLARSSPGRERMPTPRRPRSEPPWPTSSKPAARRPRRTPSTRHSEPEMATVKPARPVAPISFAGRAEAVRERLEHHTGLPGGFEDELRRACPDTATDAAARAEASRDWWPLAMHWALTGLVPGLADAVCRPVDAAEVAGVLQACDRHGVPVTAAGGRSGVCGASVPRFGGVLLDLTAIAGLVAVDDRSLVIEVLPGTFGPDLEAALATHGLTLGHWPQSMDISTVGGWLACRGAGQYSTRYGKIEDMVVGLEVVLADGRTITTGGFPRAATGPDLTQLFVGSEGTLGVITRAWLRVHPAPPAHRRRAFGFPSWDDGVEVCRRILRRGATPAVLRLYDEAESQRNQGTAGDVAVLLVLDEGDPVLIDATMAVVDAECAAATRLDDGLVERWLEHRNDVSALEALTRKGFVVDTLEIAGPWDRLPAIYRATTEALAAVSHARVATAHLSHSYVDGACLYFTFAATPPPDELETTYIRMWDAGTHAVLAAGGNLSHHHGVGLNRDRFVPEALGPALDLLVALKQALDPHGILNPGKLGLPTARAGAAWP